MGAAQAEIVALKESVRVAEADHGVVLNEISEASVAHEAALTELSVSHEQQLWAAQQELSMKLSQTEAQLGNESEAAASMKVQAEQGVARHTEEIKLAAEKMGAAQAEIVALKESVNVGSACHRDGGAGGDVVVTSSLEGRYRSLRHYQLKDLCKVPSSSFCTRLSAEISWL